MPSGACIPPYILRPALMLYSWFVIGILGIFATVAYLVFGSGQSDDPTTLVGAVAIGVAAVFLYSIPMVIARMSAHPSRAAIYVINILFGWSVLGWIVALIWALAGYHDRMADIGAARAEAESSGNLPGEGGFRFLERSGSALGTLIAIAVGFYIYWMTSNAHGKPITVVVPPPLVPASVPASDQPHRSVTESVQESYEAERSRFQEEFSELQHPETNLVWFPEDGGVLTLVTPLGPCAFIIGSDEDGYSITALSKTQVALGPSQMIGAFSSKAVAESRALEYCRARLNESAGRADGDSDKATLWFQPEDPPAVTETTSEPEP